MTLHRLRWVRLMTLPLLPETDTEQMQVRSLTRLSGSRICLGRRVSLSSPSPHPVVAYRDGTGSLISSPGKRHVAAYRKVRLRQSTSSAQHSTGDTLQGEEPSSRALVVDEQEWYPREEAKDLLVRAWSSSLEIPAPALLNSFAYTVKWCLLNDWKLRLAISNQSNKVGAVIQWSGENATPFEVRGVGENSVRSVWSLNYG